MRTDSMENGTCWTLTELWNVEDKDLRAADLHRSFDRAVPLKREDILLTLDERTQLREQLIHAVLRITVGYGGQKLQSAFRSEVLKSTPATEFKIDVHKTDIHPMPPFNIDESSKAGNAELITAMFQELGFDFSDPTFAETVKLVVGDQLSIDRLRSVAASRVGHDSGANALRWTVFVPGLFHYKMAATHGIILKHLGLVNKDLSNPASLSSHNTILGRKPIVSTSLPPYRTCRDIIFISLYARVLHCVLLVSGYPSLDALAADLSWEDLMGLAAKVVDQFTDTRLVEELREARTQDGPENGDMVFENAILFFRDALYLREFNDAIKSGDSGRVFVILKVWVLSYRGQGRTKYAQEALHLLHNMTHVWPDGLR
jgi:hypothetical protein